MKRSNGEGSIYKRNDGRWCAACYKMINGKEKRVYVYGKTQREVREKLRELKRVAKLEEVKKPEEITEKEDLQDDGVALGEWMQYWLQEYKKMRIKETTYANYKQIIETHVCRDEIGTVILTRLSTAKLQKFYDRKSREITFYGRPLSSRMVRYIATLIGGALEQAVREEKIQMNPNKMVILPRKERAEIQPLSENEVKRLLHSIEGTDLYMPILLEIYTGLRKGELLGLCWKDIDFEQRLIRVRNSLARVPLEGSEKKSELRLQTPKTRKSVRILPMTEKVVECLKEHKHQQDIRKQKNALIWQEKDLIFCKEDGDFLEPRDFLAHFQKALEKAGLRKCRFHDMRHTFASLLLNEGEELKVIQELLGHTTITTTADIYAHLKTEKKLEAVEKIGELLA